MLNSIDLQSTVCSLVTILLGLFIYGNPGIEFWKIISYVVIGNELTKNYYSHCQHLLYLTYDIYHIFRSFKN